MADAPINCTPHDIHVMPESGAAIVYKRTEHNVRLLSEPQTSLGLLADGTPVWTAQVCTGISPLPPGGAPIIVSMPVGEYLRARAALTSGAIGRMVLGPDSSPGGSVRKDGVIVGTRRLVLYCK